ncbi:MAG: DUF2254 domain-containing protein [Gammaproteobacteria bacterium]|nr:DUF2254 domain-containing protein [Gammaproteobacteria bacterium]
MKAPILKHWEDLRSSYWFVPSLMAFASILLSVAAVAIDRHFSIDASSEFAWLYINQPDGARAVLATIAGSAITVGDVVFSITIAAVAYTTSQFGPRLLTNFMRDRGNQLTLGTFIATFLYCLLVLRSVRSAGEVVGDDSALAQSFVPHIAVLIALLLALASVAVLIFFLHHLTRSIHISNVIAGIGAELLESLDELFPKKLGGSAPDMPVFGDADSQGDALTIPALEHGYCQNVDEDALLDVAVRHDVALLLNCRPGNFVHDASALAYVWPRDRLSEDGQDDVRASFAFGSKRTKTQDVMFPVSELTEVAIRALSPSVNDPFTAINCMNWLAGALVRLANRRTPAARRADDTGRLRLVVPRVSFKFMANTIWDRLRPYVSHDPNAAGHMMRLLGELAPQMPDQAARDVLRCHADALRAASDAVFTDCRDRELLADRHRATLAAISDPHALPDFETGLAAMNEAETEL